MSTLLRWLLVFAVASLPSVGRAQAPSDADQEAHTHFDSGHLHFERGEYENALREFEAAYELSHREALLYNLYLTLERLGRVSDAADRLQTYLASDVHIEPDERTILEARLTNLRERAAQAAVPPPTPTTPVAPRTSSGGGIHELGLAGIVTLGVGALSLVVFAITGGLALGEDSRLAGSCGRNVGSFCTDGDVSTLRTLDTVADVMLSVGLVAAAAGAVMLAVDLATGSDSSGSSRAYVVPLLSPTSLGVAVGGVL